MRFGLIILLFGMQGCVSIESGSSHEQALHHVVLCWLKEPGNVEQRKQIVEVSKSFREIPGVLDVRVGQVVASDRGIVDDSYDVAILVVVPDRKRLDEYLAHPVHQKAKNDILVPLVDKILVYDFKE
jgi:hypothetical protein